MNAFERLVRANAAYRRAGERLAAATKAAFPIGAHAMVTIGRARIHVVIEGYSQFNPREVVVRNTETGKVRRICSTYPPHDPEVYR